MNLYVHFPFCRRKCSYCALHSRPGASESERAAYVSSIVSKLQNIPTSQRSSGQTIYFGGGSPALCDLKPLFVAIKQYLTPETEFTVELHPLDVGRDLLAKLRDGGVNRISMGVQSLDDATLRAMGRGYTAADAERTFLLVREFFDNAGIDLIVGYPKQSGLEGIKSMNLSSWGLRHCSVYSLILEEGTALSSLVCHGRITLPGDDAVMDEISAVAEYLDEIGLKRYEISNYAVPGYECRHNLATWRGEDYIGIGDGAMGRIGLLRTSNGCVTETVTPEQDLKERTLFRLRTREGLDASRFPEWQQILDGFVAENLLFGEFPIYRLTQRGMEVCDSILADLI